MARINKGLILFHSFVYLRLIPVPLFCQSQTHSSSSVWSFSDSFLFHYFVNLRLIPIPLFCQSQTHSCSIIFQFQTQFDNNMKTIVNGSEKLPNMNWYIKKNTKTHSLSRIPFHQVVGSQARILYCNDEGRVKIALAFNQAVADGRLRVQ